VFPVRYGQIYRVGSTFNKTERWIMSRNNNCINIYHCHKLSNLIHARQLDRISIMIKSLRSPSFSIKDVTALSCYHLLVLS
jgi:hypothetical protein